MTDADHRLFSLVIVTAAMHPIVPAQPRLDREQPQDRQRRGSNPLVGKGGPCQSRQNRECCERNR